MNPSLIAPSRLEKNTSWFFRPVALGRITALRFLAYAFILIDWWYYTPWVLGHRHLPPELYQPLFIGRILPLPTPTHDFVVATLIALLAAALPAMLNIAPRFFGWIVAVAYLEWMIIAMSYGKVDHGKFALLVLLFVLPTIRKTSWGDTTNLSPKAGWAINLIQIAVVCTYFLAAFAKLRFGGFEWVNSATMTRAVLRRGTDLSTWMLDYPWILKASQWGIVGFELLSPIVLFVAAWRFRYAIVGFFYSFHLVVYLTVTISFLPHLVAMTCFLPLEKLNPPKYIRSAYHRIRALPTLPQQRTVTSDKTTTDIPATHEKTSDNTAKTTPKGR